MDKSTLNLIESWLAVKLVPGMSIAQSIRDLNDDMRTKYSPQRFNEWRRGDRPIPQPVQDYMMRVSIGHAMRSEGIDIQSLDNDTIDRIAIRLTPPRR